MDFEAQHKIGASGEAGLGAEQLGCGSSCSGSRDGRAATWQA